MIFTKPESSKAAVLMSLTFLGISISFKFTQPAKACFSIEKKFSGSSILLIPLSAKANIPLVVIRRQLYVGELAAILKGTSFNFGNMLVVAHYKITQVTALVERKFPYMLNLVS